MLGVDAVNPIRDVQTVELYMATFIINVLCTVIANLIAKAIWYWIINH